MKPAALLTTNIVGGLGNQLFLVANLLATSHRTHIPAFLDPLPYSSSSEAPRPTYWSSVFRDVQRHGVQLTATPPTGSSSTAFSSLPWVTVPEVRPVRKIELDPQRACVYNMIGFFQCAEFFDDYSVLHSVIPRDLWEAAAVHLRRYYCCAADGRHTIALHIRRGDYTRFTDIFEQLEVDYYDAAVRQLLGGMLLQPSSPSFSPPHLLLFSDDLRVGQTFAGYFSTKYKGVRVSVVNAALEEEKEGTASATNNCGCEGGDAGVPRDVLELLMMALCSDVVMANSTFSWWGAYLNHRPLHRVVAPSRWFVKDRYPASNHLYCPGWMLI